MGVPASSVVRGDASGPVPPRLSRRASLNSLAAMLDYGARFGVELVITPLLISGLGDYLYGTWKVLWQWTGYVWAASGRSAQALQSAIANRQSSRDADEKRQLVAAAVVVWLLFLPLLLAIGVAGVWFAPYFLDTPDEYVGAVRLAAVILVADSVALTLLTVPRAVLQGENLGYKRMGVSALVLLAGGGLMVLAVELGAGLPGVAAATLATTVLTAAIFLHVVRKHVSWFGVARPSRRLLRWFLGLSWWFLAWKLVFEMMTASDLLILAGLASVQLVTVYVVTKFVADALSVLLLTLVQGATPGLGGIIGSGNLEKAVRVRQEMLALTWLLTTAGGAAIIVWNEAFVSLWVGESRYAGDVASLLVVLMVVQFIFVRSDNYVIDVTLRLPVKVMLGALSTAVSIAAACLLVGVFELGIVGLVVGVMAGRLLLTFASPWLVGRALHEPLRRQVRGAVRPFLVAAALFWAAFQLGRVVPDDSWVLLVAGGALTLVVAAAVAAAGGLNGRQRTTLVRRVRAVRGGR